jgi:hypothetical protein
MHLVINGIYGNKFSFKCLLIICIWNDFGYFIAFLLKWKFK